MADVTLDVKDGLGVITLQRPRALNALDTAMACAARGALDAWRDDPAVRAVWLQGAGDKAFCAGGDVRAVAERFRTHDDGQAFAERYFVAEYGLDFALHAFPKPVVVWGHGFVLGGGLGMLLGGSHRVVTPTSRLAMPEIRIGLFPDVGASWFLARLGPVGTFLALTAARLPPGDALDLGLADVFVPSASADDARDAVAAALAAGGSVDDGLGPLSGGDAERRLPARRERLTALLRGDDVALLERVAAAVDDADGWIAEGARTLAAGSPLSARVILEQLRLARTMSLADVLRQDLMLAARAVRGRDFHEGVGSLLLDKHGAPRWAHAAFGDVREDEVAAWFTPLHDHPLAGLAGRGRHEG